MSQGPQAEPEPVSADAEATQFTEIVQGGDDVSVPASAVVAGEVRVVPFVPEHLRPRMGGDHVPILGGPSDRALGQENSQKAS